MADMSDVEMLADVAAQQERLGEPMAEFDVEMADSDGVTEDETFVPGGALAALAAMKSAKDSAPALVPEHAQHALLESPYPELEPDVYDEPVEALTTPLEPPAVLDPAHLEEGMARVRAIFNDRMTQYTQGSTVGVAKALSAVQTSRVALYSPIPYTDLSGVTKGVVLPLGATTGEELPVDPMCAMMPNDPVSLTELERRRASVGGDVKTPQNRPAQRALTHMDMPPARAVGFAAVACYNYGIVARDIVRNAIIATEQRRNNRIRLIRDRGSFRGSLRSAIAQGCDVGDVKLPTFPAMALPQIALYAEPTAYALWEMCYNVERGHATADRKVFAHPGCLEPIRAMAAVLDALSDSITHKITPTAVYDRERYRAMRSGIAPKREALEQAKLEQSFATQMQTVMGGDPSRGMLSGAPSDPSSDPSQNPTDAAHAAYARALDQAAATAPTAEFSMPCCAASGVEAWLRFNEVSDCECEAHDVRIAAPPAKHVALVSTFMVPGALLRACMEHRFIQTIEYRGSERDVEVVAIVHAVYHAGDDATMRRAEQAVLAKWRGSPEVKPRLLPLGSLPCAHALAYHTRNHRRDLEAMLRGALSDFVADPTLDLQEVSKVAARTGLFQSVPRERLTQNLMSSRGR
jgi:hypothetical protein